MKRRPQKSRLRSGLQTALLAMAILYAVYFLNYFIPTDLRIYGIRPREIEGLWGILCSPFLHGNYRHLLANTGALFALLLVAFAFSRKLTWVAIIIITLVGGGLVWLFGTANSVHIGASGLIFGLIGFLMFIGFFRREWAALAVSLSVFLLYGGALLSLLSFVPGVSWSGHFFGFAAGVMAAWWTRAAKAG